MKKLEYVRDQIYCSNSQADITCVLGEMFLYLTEDLHLLPTKVSSGTFFLYPCVIFRITAD